MSLQNLQLEFAEAVCSGNLQIETVLPIQNLRIYQNNILKHLLKALQTTYPLIVKLVGEDFFQICAKEYIKQYPSRSGDLNDYGEYFSDFLVKYDPVKDLIYLAEVAQFEWICHLLLTAAQPPALDIDVLNKISPENYEQIRFVLHPASKIVKFYHPILRIIELCQKDIGDDVVELGDEGVNLLMIRRDLDISLIPLSEGDYIFLTSLAEGQSVAAALETTLQADPTFELDNKLANWVKDKLIVDCFLE